MDNNVRYLQAANPPIASGGSGGYDGNMEHRITALETRLDTILPTLATKADIHEVRSEIHEAKADLVKWIVGTAIGLAVAGITVMTFVLNNATQKQPPVQQPPIIINIPAEQQQTPPTK